MSGPTGVPRQRTFEPNPIPAPTPIPGRPHPRRRPAPRGRALLLALGTLAAPALAVVALTAFGALSDEPESGLGSLPAAEGLQGSTQSTAPPEGDGGPAAAAKEKDDSEFASDDRSGGNEGEGSRPAPQPVLADCPGEGGPRAQTSKRRAASSSGPAASAADCGGTGKPERTVDGDVAPGGSAPVERPQPEPVQPPAGGYEGDEQDSDDHGGPGGSGPGGP